MRVVKIEIPPKWVCGRCANATTLLISRTVYADGRTRASCVLCYLYAPLDDFEYNAIRWNRGDWLRPCAL